MADKAAASQKAAAEHVSAMKADRERIGALKNGVVNVQSLRIRADHNTTSEVVGGLVHENDVTILSTWSDGRNTWAKLDNGWAAMVYDGETYIKSAKSTSEIEPNWKYDYKKE
jgi:hypothetical protein